MTTPDAPQENNAPAARKKGGRPKSATPNSNAADQLPKRTRAGRASGGNPLGPKRAGAGKKTKGAAKRPALKEIPNLQSGAEAGDEREDVDDFDDLDDGPGESSVHMSTPMTATKQPSKKTGSVEQVAEREKPKRGKAKIRRSIEEIPETQQPAAATSNMSKAQSRGLRKPKPAKQDTVIPETQPEPMDVDQAPAEQEVRRPGKKPPPRAKPQVASAPKRGAPSASRRRAGSTSDGEGGGNDSVSQRKCSDMQSKLESLQVKYDSLRDIAVTEAQSNFEKLRLKSEEGTTGTSSSPQQQSKPPSIMVLAPNLTRRHSRRDPH